MDSVVLNEKYWTDRWINGQTGWDIGYPSPAIVEFVINNISKDSKILIPGAGNAYEAEALYKAGYADVTVVDISKVPLKNLKKRFPGFPEHQLVHSDFFNLPEEQYDLILEQTFFCALNPSLRDHYVKKSWSLLRKGGQLAGLLFDFPLTEEGPPFGGCYEEYEVRFSKLFKIISLEKTNKSIEPRVGRELFIHLQKI